MRLPKMRWKNSTGFTLIEVMITVVIVGILAAVAYPSYRSHVVKSNRAAAQSFLMTLSSREEQLMLDQRLYTAAADNAAVQAAPINQAVPTEVSRYYAISVAAQNPGVGGVPLTTPPNYTITAAPTAGTMQASDGTMALDNAGNKTPASLWK
jgi:type IV pilus assembly protein PilE